MRKCDVCGSVVLQKRGTIEKMIVYKSGKRKKQFQAFRCENGHTITTVPETTWSDTFIEYVVFVYLQSLSLNATIEIVRATFEDEVLSKAEVLMFMAWVADALPTLDETDNHYFPHRSGYLAFDGVWFGYGSGQIVLLVCFDPVSFDVISAIWNDDENQTGYNLLIRQVLNKLPKDRVKAVYGDGDNGLMLSLKHYLPRVPFQLCAVHKILRMSQVVPVARAGRSRQMSEQVKVEIKEFARLFRETLIAVSKEEAVEKLGDLLIWTAAHPSERFSHAVNQLKHNFHLTLTHFDYPGMMRDNNLIECFNGCLKPRLTLMKGFKKEDNLDRYLKLFLSDFRFHNLKESRFAHRRDKSPMELGGVLLPQYYNFLTLLRTEFHLSYQPKTP